MSKTETIEPVENTMRAGKICDACGHAVPADEITKVLVMVDDGVAKLVKLCPQCISEDSEDPQTRVDSDKRTEP